MRIKDERDYREIIPQVLVSDHDLVVLGTPESTVGRPDLRPHRCDEMGCGLQHVIYRVKTARPVPITTGELTGIGWDRLGDVVGETTRDFIEGLTWSKDTKPYVRSVVVGNLRGLMVAIADALEKRLGTPRDTASVPVYPEPVVLGAGGGGPPMPPDPEREQLRVDLAAAAKVVDVREEKSRPKNLFDRL